MEKILILGASGLVGKALSKELNKKYEVYGTFNTKEVVSIKPIPFKLSEINKIKSILMEVKPEKIVYCLRGDFSLEIELIKEIVSYLKTNDGSFYFCSTANVFDGDTTKPHFKDEGPIAISDYGKFKIECEKMINKGLGSKGIIFRLPMIWGKDSPRLNNITTSLKNNTEIEVYTNVYFNTNLDVMLAKQISYIIEKDLRGIFHLGSKDVINYFEFVKSIVIDLGYTNHLFKEEGLQEEKSYFAVLPSVNELPIEFEFSNYDVITALIN